MAGKNAEDKRRTVVLAADICSYSTPVINLAVEIAASVDSKLQGVFIEDEELLTLLQSPLTREISLVTASAMPTGEERVQRMLRSVARQFAATLEREAQALKIAWSYEYVRGRMQDVGLKAGIDVGITILGRTGLHRIESGRGGDMRRVFMLADRSPQQANALAVVLRRFAGNRIEVTRVTDAGHGDSNLEFGKQGGLPEARLVLREVDREQMFELLRNSGHAFDCAILPMRGSAEELALILKTLQCPVILLA